MYWGELDIVGDDCLGFILDELILQVRLAWPACSFHRVS
jgi:hypothetical protein